MHLLNGYRVLKVDTPGPKKNLSPSETMEACKSTPWSIQEELFSVWFWTRDDGQAAYVEVKLPVL